MRNAAKLDKNAVGGTIAWQPELYWTMKFVLSYAATLLTVTRAKVSYPELDLPSYFQVCAQTDDKLNECLRDSIQKICENLSNGYEEFGIPAMDPMFFPSIKMDLSRDNAKLRILGKNFQISGFSKIQVREVRSNISIESMSLQIDVFLDDANVEGVYKIDGHFYTFPLNSRGLVNVTMNGVALTWNINGVTEVQNGKTYMRIQKFALEPTVQDMNVGLTGLFPNNKELNNLAVAFINRYWRSIYKELYPIAERNWEDYLVETTNSIFLNIPFRRLLTL